MLGLDVRVSRLPFHQYRLGRGSVCMAPRPWGKGHVPIYMQVNANATAHCLRVRRTGTFIQNQSFVRLTTVYTGRLVCPMHSRERMYVHAKKTLTRPRLIAYTSQPSGSPPISTWARVCFTAHALK